MRIALSIIFVLLVLVLAFCSFMAAKSRKSTGKTVAYFVVALIMPVTGNLLIISSIYEVLSTVGCYVYFLGMNLVFFTLVPFTRVYCNLPKRKDLTIIKYIFYSLLILDSVQLLLNLVFHHAFTLESIEAFGDIYYRFVPGWGQTIHRVIDYSILAIVLVIFFVKLFASPKVYAEKYLVIILAMVAVGAWQTYYIFSRIPVDISMVGFAVFGVLVFLLSIYYRPLRLLDRMLAAIASKMPEGIIFFDTTGRCIWANQKALDVLGVTSDQLDEVDKYLTLKFGDYKQDSQEWTSAYQSGSGEEMESYEIEKRNVTDDKNHIVGSYLNIRDNTKEQKTIEKETYNANHDSLTKVLNRAGYDALMDSIDIKDCFLVLLDIDSFKEANDKYGHRTGDRVLICMTNIIQENFRKEDHLCRIGGDEFAIVITDANPNTAKLVQKRIDAINAILREGKDDLPLCTISAGGAYGKDAENDYELFNNADHALYERKFSGKCGFTLFKKR